MQFATADLYDAHTDQVEVVAPGWMALGTRSRFAGQVATVEAPEDNSLVRSTLEEPGAGRVLVVDGGGSMRCALIGDKLAALAVENGWTGIVVHGCVRDAEAIDELDLGVRALATCPARSVKAGRGRVGVPVAFGGVTFRPGAHLYVDRDGMLLAAQALDL